MFSNVYATQSNYMRSHVIHGYVCRYSFFPNRYHLTLMSQYYHRCDEAQFQIYQYYCQIISRSCCYLPSTGSFSPAIWTCGQLMKRMMMIPMMKQPLENRTNFNAPVGRNLYRAMIAPPLNPPMAPAKADTRPAWETNKFLCESIIGSSRECMQTRTHTLGPHTEADWNILETKSRINFKNAYQGFRMLSNRYLH